jgi:hypothetical protein
MPWPTAPAPGQEISSSTSIEIIAALSSWGGNVEANGNDLTGVGTIGAARVQATAALTSSADESDVGWSSWQSSLSAGATRLLVGMGTDEAYIQAMQGSTSWSTRHLYLQPNGGYVKINMVSSHYANDAAAAAGGVPLLGLYRNGNAVQIRLT